MGKGYVGTSSEAAPILVALGWPRLRLECIETATEYARRAALVDGGDPVVLECDYPSLDLAPGLSAVADVDPLQLRVHSIPDPAATAKERLGFCATAGVGDVVNGLLQVLDESHKAIRNAIDVGQGGNAELPSAQMLKRTLREIRGKDPDDDDDTHNKARRKAQNGLRKFFKKTQRHVMKTIKGLKKGKPGVKKATAPKAPRRPAPDTRKRAPKSDWAPKGTKAKSENIKWSPEKKASTDMKVAGKLNGKRATITILAGKKYRVAKTKEGLRVSRPGLRGVFIASPSSAGRL